VLPPVFGRPQCLAAQDTMHFACQACRRPGELLCPCGSDGCTGALLARKRRGGALRAD
jgi:hypothetical protein